MPKKPHRVPILAFACFAIAVLAAGCHRTENLAAALSRPSDPTDMTPMPDTSAWVAEAAKWEPAAQFVLHMMYRDDIGNVRSLFRAAPIDREDVLDDDEMFSEMIRWRSESRERGFPYSALANWPSLYWDANYEIYAEIIEYGAYTRETARGDACGKDEERAREYLEQAARRGYGHAEYVLGLLYWNGLCVGQDRGLGARWIRRAAEHGIANAQYHLAMIYALDPSGTLAHPEESLHWLETAAQNGSRDAVFVLGMMYYDGIGVEKNPQKAREILKMDEAYHVWTQLAHTALGEFSHVCLFEASLWPDLSGVKYRYHEHYGPCDAPYWEYPNQVCGDEDDDWDEDEEDDGEKQESVVASHGDDPDAERTRQEEEAKRQEYEACLEDMEDRKFEYWAEHSLPYSIDYATAREWLKRAASDPNHLTARTLRAQTIVSCGCLGGMDSNGDEAFQTALDILEPAAMRRELGAEYQIARLYYAKVQRYDYADYQGNYSLSCSGDEADVYQDDFDSPSHREKSRQMARIAFDWYRKAAEHGDRNAQEFLANLYQETKLERRNEQDFRRWLDLEVDMDKSIAYRMKAENYDDAIYDMRMLARKAKEESQAPALNDAERYAKELQALEWYQKALDVANAHEIEGYSHLYVEIAEIYDRGSQTIRDLDTALMYYRKAAGNGGYRNLGEYSFKAAMAIAQIYRNHPSSAQNRQERDRLAFQWYKCALESARYEDKNNQEVLAVFHTRPNAHIQNEVDALVRLALKKENDFRRIADAIMPPNHCGSHDCYITESIRPLFDKAIRDAISAIAALSLAISGKIDVEYVDNTFYEFAIIQARNHYYWLDLPISYCPTRYAYFPIMVPREDEKVMIFYIWYLGLVASAAQQAFHSRVHTKQPWEDYLDKAREAVQNTAELRDAFGVNLLERYQTEPME